MATDNVTAIKSKRTKPTARDVLGEAIEELDNAIGVSWVLSHSVEQSGDEAAFTTLGVIRRQLYEVRNKASIAYDQLAEGKEVQS